MAESAWTAILLAGQRPGENEFANSHGVQWKALIPVAGEPMLGRVARTLLASSSVARIIVLGQDAESMLSGELAWMREEPRIGTANAGNGIANSIASLAGTAAAPYPVLVTTADHALLTSQMVEHFLGAAGEDDVAAGLVERGTVEAEFPQTKRTWLRFSDGDYSGANLFALRTGASAGALRIWAEVEQDRKKATKLMMHFGPMLALRALTRTISLDAALKQVGRKAGLSVRAVRLPFARAAIDVDKQADLELAERILSGAS